MASCIAVVAGVTIFTDSPLLPETDDNEMDKDIGDVATTERGSCVRG